MKVMREFVVQNEVKDNLTQSEKSGIEKLQKRAKAVKEWEICCV